MSHIVSFYDQVIIILIFNQIPIKDVKYGKKYEFKYGCKKKEQEIRGTVIRR